MRYWRLDEVDSNVNGIEKWRSDDAAINHMTSRKDFMRNVALLVVTHYELQEGRSLALRVSALWISLCSAKKKTLQQRFPIWCNTTKTLELISLNAAQDKKKTIHILMKVVFCCVRVKNNFPPRSW